MPPEDILSQLTQKMCEQGQEFTVSDTIWRVNFELRKQINQEPEEEDEEENKGEEFTPVFENVQIQFEIQKVPDRDQMFFVTFKRKAGAAILFYDSAKLYMDSLALFNNATLEEGETQWSAAHHQPIGLPLWTTINIRYYQQHFPYKTI